MEDMGISRKLRLLTDASVAKCISNRRGIGGVRHLEVSQLWLQDRFHKGDFEIQKVHTDINRADALTKYQDGLAIDRVIIWLGEPLGRIGTVKCPS